MQIANPTQCTGNWAQQFKCGWHQPANASVTHAGLFTGHSVLPVLLLALAVILILRVVMRSGGGRRAATSK